MVVRLPGPVHTPSRPLNAPAEQQPPNGVAAALDRMQARDDADFIATSLARLGARQMAAFDAPPRNR